MMNFPGLFNVILGATAIIAGANVMHGLLTVSLRGKTTVHFLRYSLVANVAGLLPLTRHIIPIQAICMLSVYCSAAAFIALRLHLFGWWRPTFAFVLTAALYLDVVTVSIQIFRYVSALDSLLDPSFVVFRTVQLLMAAGFGGLAIVTVQLTLGPVSKDELTAKE